MTRRTYKGRFSPKHPSKYKGDPTNIIFRSGWEFEVMRWLDEDQRVIKWQSEEIVIPYLCPTDNRPHRYFPDFWVELKDGDTTKTFIVEIKPLKETKPPKIPKKKTKQYLIEVMTWGKNEAKWKAAQEYCAYRGWEFKIFTEKEIFGDGKRKKRT